MKPEPISEILRRIHSLPREHKIFVLRGHVASAKKRSVRRTELEAALKRLVNTQIEAELRRDRKESKAA